MDEQQNGSFCELVDGGTTDLCVALIGGGGKTSLLLQLARELVSIYPRLLVSSLTEMEAELEDISITPDQGNSADLQAAWSEHHPLFVFGPRNDRGKLTGLPIDLLNRLSHKANATLFECDGARNLSLKAHNFHDPKVPEFATHVIVVVGADVVGKTLDSGAVHRPDLFEQTWGIRQDAPLTADVVAEVVTSPRGYASLIPDGTLVRYLVNKADTFPEQARLLGRAIHSRCAWPVMVGSLHEGWLEEVKE